MSLHDAFQPYSEALERRQVKRDERVASILARSKAREQVISAELRATCDGGSLPLAADDRWEADDEVARYSDPDEWTM